MTSAEIKQSLQNPSTSFWLKAAIEKLENRDVLDAARDADILALFARKRLEESSVSFIQTVK